MWIPALMLFIVVLLPCVVLSADTGLKDVYTRLAALEDRLTKSEEELSTQKAVILAQEQSINNLKSTVKSQQDTNDYFQRMLKIQDGKIDDQQQTIQFQERRIQELEDYIRERQDESEDTANDKHIDRNETMTFNVLDKLHKAVKKRDHTGKISSNAGLTKRQVEGGGIAFSAYLDHDITTGEGQTVQFNMIITNEGNAYNNHTGVFTCPEAGLYLFSFSVGQRDSGHQAYVYLTVNSENIIDAVAETTSTYEDDQGSNTVVIRLNAGDSVWIRTPTANHHIEGSEVRITSFTGVYLYP